MERNYAEQLCISGTGIQQSFTFGHGFQPTSHRLFYKYSFECKKIKKKVSFFYYYYYYHRTRKMTASMFNPNKIEWKMEEEEEEFSIEIGEDIEEEEEEGGDKSEDGESLKGKRKKVASSPYFPQTNSSLAISYPPFRSSSAASPSASASSSSSSSAIAQNKKPRSNTAQISFRGDANDKRKKPHHQQKEERREEEEEEETTTKIKRILSVFWHQNKLGVSFLDLESGILSWGNTFESKDFQVLDTRLSGKKKPRAV